MNFKQIERIELHLNMLKENQVSYELISTCGDTIHDLNERNYGSGICLKIKDSFVDRKGNPTNIECLNLTVGQFCGAVQNICNAIRIANNAQNTESKEPLFTVPVIPEPKKTTTKKTTTAKTSKATNKNTTVKSRIRNIGKGKKSTPKKSTA